MDSEENLDHLVISKINNFIYLGSREHPLTNTEEFEKLEIDVIINCSIEVVYPVYEENKYIIKNFRIKDGDTISFLDNIDIVVDTMHRYLCQGKKIYLHGVKGISRSPAILIYYLMAKKGFRFDRAYDLLRKIRPIVEINEEFENALRCIEE